MVTAVEAPAPPPTAPAASAAAERWSEAAAAATAATVPDPRLGRCLYVSRLVGGDPDLVLHGGGNTSVKSVLPDLGGAPQEVLWVKGSGHDLAGVTAESFTPVALAPLRRLPSVAALDDAALTAALRRAMLDPAAPPPSVETLTHAILPHRYVLHAHPDAVLAATSVPGGAAAARRLFGPAYPVIRWAAPGLALARAVDRLWRDRAADELRGIVLLHHGVLTFGDDARLAWEAMLECVARAAAALPAAPSRAASGSTVSWSAPEIATLRKEVSRLAGRPMIVTLDDSGPARQFAGLPAAGELADLGPLSACNVLRTKRTAALVPCPAAIRSALARFDRRYRAYFRRFARGRTLTMHDAAPRVLVAPGAGVFCCGRTAAEAAAVRDLWRHTMPAMLAAEQLGGYRPLAARQVFDLEYGPLDEGRRADDDVPPLAGKVALVTGAARGVGRAATVELLAQGAAVIGVDLEPTPAAGGYLGVSADLREPDAVEAVLESAARSFGGLDLLISNVAGPPQRCTLDQLSIEEWRSVMDLDATSHLALLRAAIPLLARAATSASVVLVGSRNALGPGLGQLGRVAALELAASGIRVNVLHSDAAVDSALGAARRHNLLHVEVRPCDVARLAVALCGDLFACTTGAQIPVDGGDSRLI